MGIPMDSYAICTKTPPGSIGIPKNPYEFVRKPVQVLLEFLWNSYEICKKTPPGSMGGNSLRIPRNL